MFSKLRHAFNMTNNMVSSDRWGNLILANIILTTDGTIGCVEWQLVPNGLVPNCWCKTTYLPSVVRCWHKLSYQDGGVGRVQWASGVGKELHEVEVRVIEQDLILYVGQLQIANVPFDGWITAMIYMTSLIVLLILCTSRLMCSKWTLHTSSVGSCQMYMGWGAQCCAPLNSPEGVV